MKPAAHPKPANIVRHEAWCEARNCILAAAGPATLGLVGAAGTGKTWLLRELAADLRERGYEVTLLRQGDLPCTLAQRAALLVDEASRMDEEGLAALAAQRRGLVVLADLPAFAATLERLSPPPAIISLPRLDPQQLRRFVAVWAEGASERGMTLTQDAALRLAVHSCGTPRLVVQLLSAALALAGGSGQARIGGAEIDQAAELRLGGLGPEPVQPVETELAAPRPTQPPPAGVPRRAKPMRIRQGVLALSALAASVLLGWGIANWGRRVAVEQALVPSPAIATSAASPALVTDAAVFSPLIPAAALAPKPPVALADKAAPPPLPPVLAAPPALAPAPAAVSALPPPDIADAVAAPSLDPGHGGPGLILIARRGDTLEELYANIYRGVRPPSYGEVVAANPRPFRPGAMIVFPAPPGGWSGR